MADYPSIFFSSVSALPIIGLSIASNLGSTRLDDHHYDDGDGHPFPEIALLEFPPRFWLGKGYGMTTPTLRQPPLDSKFGSKPRFIPFNLKTWVQTCLNAVTFHVPIHETPDKPMDHVFPTGGYLLHIPRHPRVVMPWHPRRQFSHDSTQIQYVSISLRWPDSRVLRPCRCGKPLEGRKWPLLASPGMYCFIAFHSPSPGREVTLVPNPFTPFYRRRSSPIFVIATSGFSWCFGNLSIR